MATHTGRRWVLLGAGLVAAACDEGSTVTLQPGTEIACSIPESMIFRAQAVNGIPALTNPDLVTPGAPGTEPFRDEDRVVGIVWEGRQIAVPLNIFWWHEIVNFELAGNPLSVTHCPLTGSSIGFDRAGLPQVDLGVSGLLYQNNLIMYDRAGGSDTLWPQMALGARCGALSGAPLPTIPVVEMTYGAWRALHPETLVVSADTGHQRNYAHWAYPYGTYDLPEDKTLLFPLTGGIDLRLPPKERVLGIPDGTGGVAYSYGALEALGARAAVGGILAGREHVVFWDSEARGAMAFYTEADGKSLSFRVSEGEIIDVETASIWALDGRSTAGPLQGLALEPVSSAFVAFWFAWPRFFPDISLWSR